MSESVSIPTLATSRLVLRPFTLADAPAVQALLASPEISTTTLNIAFPYPEGAAEKWISSHPTTAQDGKSLTWAISRASDDVLVGAIGLGLDWKHMRGSLGYWLGVQFWNNGYMSEAATAVTGWAFQALGLHRVEAGCVPRNVASARVMENAGLIYEGTLKGYVRKGEEFEDIAMYARIVGS